MKHGSDINCLILFAIPLMVAGCAASADAPATRPTTPAAGSPKPFMMKEASLPVGFPPPGPVDQVIVKHYPAYRAAVILADQQAASQNIMFRLLFNHIKANRIAMTAPIEMTYPDAGGADAPLSMAFLYANPALGRPGKEGAVEVRDLPPATVLSIALRGSYSRQRYLQGLNQLRAWLEQNPGQYRASGPPRYLAYNSPFVLGFLKLSEVQLPIVRDDAPQR